MIQVTLKQPVVIDEVDAEIIIVAGCAFGFVAPQQPMHVLNVDPGTEMSSHGIKSDDLLVAIDGQDTRTMERAEIAKRLRACSHLGLERSKLPVDGDGEETEPPSDGEQRQRAPRAPQLASPFGQGTPVQLRARDSTDHPPQHGASSGGLPPSKWNFKPQGSRPPPPPGWHGGAPLGPPPGPPSREPSFGPPGMPQGLPPGAWRARPAPEYGRTGPKLQSNESGGVSLVAERLHPSVNNTSVLNEYFGRFGTVSSIVNNHRRNEAIITFRRMEDAEEALRWPVLNDRSVLLRPWSNKKAGRADSHEASSSVAVAASPPAIAETPAVAWPSGNATLEDGKVAENSKKKQDVEDKRNKLLQSLTDQLKIIMTKLTSPKTTDKNKEALQSLLDSIKGKITELTPPEKKQPEIEWVPYVPDADEQEEMALPVTPAPIHREAAVASAGAAAVAPPVAAASVRAARLSDTALARPVEAAVKTSTVASSPKPKAAEAVDLTIIDLSRVVAARPKAKLPLPRPKAVAPGSLALKERELRSVSPISEPGFDMVPKKKKRRRPRQDAGSEEDAGRKQKKRKDFRSPDRRPASKSPRRR